MPRGFGLADPRSYGSENPGATNVMRSGNRLAGRLVFLLDFAKGALPAGLRCPAGWPRRPRRPQPAAGAVAGHVFSPLLGIQGRQGGVATGMGAILALDWRLFALAAGVFALVYVLLRLVSMASVIGMVVAAAAAVLLAPGSPAASALATIAFIVVMRHRANFKRMLAGQEKAFAASKEKAAGRR